MIVSGKPSRSIGELTLMLRRFLLAGLICGFTGVVASSSPTVAAPFTTFTPVNVPSVIVGPLSSDARFALVTGGTSAYISDSADGSARLVGSSRHSNYGSQEIFGMTNDGSSTLVSERYSVPVASGTSPSLSRLTLANQSTAVTRLIVDGLSNFFDASMSDDGSVIAWNTWEATTGGSDGVWLKAGTQPPINLTADLAKDPWTRSPAASVIVSPPQGHFGRPIVSGDGRSVLFTYVNSTQPECGIYYLSCNYTLLRYDLSTGKRSIANLEGNGTPRSSENVGGYWISTDGRYVSWVSGACGGICNRDTLSQVVRMVAVDPYFYPTVSADGLRILGAVTVSKLDPSGMVVAAIEPYVHDVYAYTRYPISMPPGVTDWCSYCGGALNADGTKVWLKAANGQGYLITSSAGPAIPPPTGPPLPPLPTPTPPTTLRQSTATTTTIPGAPREPAPAPTPQMMPPPTSVPPPVSAPAPAPKPIETLVPGRLFDSRLGVVTVDGIGAGSGVVAAGATVRVKVAGRHNIPTDAVSAALNVTATGTRASGFLTVWPCGVEKPNASTLNFVAGATIANTVIAKIGTNGEVCVTSSAATDLIIDASGFEPAGASFTGLVPGRLLDTRLGGVTVDGLAAGGGRVLADAVVRVKVAGRNTIPASAGSAVLNVTATGTQAAGFLTVWPCGADQPNASNLNFGAGATIANTVIAKIGTDGEVCITPSAATDLIVDVSGFEPTGASFASLVPGRLLDSRPGGVTVDGVSAGGGRVAADRIVRVKVAGRHGIPDATGSAVLNVTAAGTQAPGFLTVWPCGSDKPNASNLNFGTGATIANAVIAKIGTNGEVCISSSSSTDVLLDVSGYTPSI
jgi:hypothetical protein